MKKLRILSLMVTLLMAVTIFSGCGAKTTGTIIVGTNAEFPPFEFINAKGEPDGFDIALMKEIGKLLNKEVKVENMEFKSLIGALETGKIDCAAAAMTVDEERKKAANFSDSYYTAVQKIVLREGDTSIKSVEDLKGKKIGVQEGTTGDIIATDDIENSTVSRHKKGVDAVIDLKNKKIDAVLIDNNPAEEFAKANKGSVYLVDSKCEPEDYGIAIRKDKPELLEEINKSIKTLKENGTFDKLVKEYINK